MYIGCNWSNALGILINGEEVNIDYIKSGVYGNFNELFSTMHSLRPILLHGLGYFEHTGMKNIDMIDFNLEYSYAAEPQFRCGVSHLSETAEPLNLFTNCFV